jgi:hypothetical protein
LQQSAATSAPEIDSAIGFMLRIGASFASRKL